MENDDDMWNLYNILDKGDFVQGKITRKVAIEGSLGSERKTMAIVLRVEEVEYDQEANLLRVKGKNISENKFIQVGQFQSMEINSTSNVTLIKVFTLRTS
jgi:protein pelota